MSGKVTIENMTKVSALEIEELADGTSFIFDNDIYIVNKYENLFAFSICGKHIITEGDMSYYRSAKLVNLRVIVE